MVSKVPDFSQVKVLIVGDVMLDRYWCGAASRISPEAPVPIVNVHETFDRPGGAGNVALNTVALGAQAELIGVTGEDSAADILEQHLEMAGIGSHLQRLNDHTTIEKLRVLSKNQQLIRLDFEKPVVKTALAAIQAVYEEALARAVDVIVLSDYAKGALGDNCSKLIALAKAQDIPVLVDPKQNDYEAYRGATLVTPNFKEFLETVGPCATEADVLSKGYALMERYEIEALLVTRGEHGMTLLRHGEEEVYLPAKGREVCDVTGAGDTVIAVLASALATGIGMQQSVTLANAAAGIVIGKLGAATVSTAELSHATEGLDSMNSKIVTREQLKKLVYDAKVSGQRIVFTNGCFDILHALHVDYLQLAKQLGDKLIVAVNADETVRRSKGPGRPVNKVEHRLAVLAGLESIDWLLAFAEDTPCELLEILKPDVLAKGGDYSEDEVVGAEIVKAYGGQVEVLGGVIEGVKTTAIIERAKNSENHDDY